MKEIFVDEFTALFSAHVVKVLNFDEAFLDLVYFCAGVVFEFDFFHFLIFLN